MSGIGDIEATLASWADHPDLEGELVHVHRIPERGAITSRLDPPLAPLLTARLAERGIEDLYRHQATANRHIRDGRHTVVVAGTASGKTLCYQAPIVERALAGAVSRQEYLAFLGQAYHHVKHTTPLLMACGSRVPGDARMGR